MRRQKEDMQVNVAGFRRNIKNLAHNYSDAQVKVREATSNDPWGPSSTLMSEIADLTYNVVAFTEIMQMVWKRLNDHGRNWRHVYKALVLLEYLIKTGTEKVAQQCKENIFAIQTLKDFQYFEESKDQGLNVREKAKQLVSLLKDDERLRNERARALKAKERFAQAASGFGSEGMDTVSPSSPSFPAGFQGSWSSCEVEPTSRELETARPQTVGEEELQLQLALAMSREEAEQEEQRRRSDDVRLQLALSQSEEEFKYHHSQGKGSSEKQSHMLDLLDVNLGNHSTHPPHAAALDPWGFPQPVPQSPPTRPQNDPWSSPASSVPSASTVASPTPAVDPWTPVPSSAVELVHHKPPAVVDPWRAVSPQPPARPAVSANDPWSPSTNTDHSSPGTASPRAGLSSPNGGDLDEFDVITNRERPALNNSQVNNVNSLNNNGGTVSPDPFDMSLLGDSLENKQQQKKTPHSFLGENSALVNLDNLVTVSKPPSVAPSPDFREVILELERVIPAAQFLAIDGEFTGLRAGQDVNAFDTPSQYYSKLRSGSMDFLLVQFGLCAFSYDRENDKYMHRAYNFYIFPKQQVQSSPDPRFLCQSSSIDFLASQGFDFNKLFREGITYLTQPEEQKLRDHLEEKHKSCSNTNSSSPGTEENSHSIPIPDEYVSTVEDACSRIEAFLASSEPEELELDRCNAFVRKLIFQTVRQRFDSNAVQLESRLTEGRNRVLVVARCGSPEERKKREKEKRDKELQDLEDAVGFSLVLKKISESGKLIIGHNMLLDVCHVINQCYFPLPEDYSEFKEMVNCVFPKVLDTKYMSDLPLFKNRMSSNILGHMYKTLSEEPFKMCIAKSEAEGHGYSTLNDKYHEAAYDAYVTGLCFIAMANHLGSLQNPKVYPVLPSSPLLNPCLNKLFLVRVQDSPYINLVGEDPIVSRDHVFFVSFPKEWKTYDLIQLFSPFGGVFIAWLNSTSAYVALYHRDQASLVLKTLTQSDTYIVMTYAAHQKLQDEGAVCKCAHSSGKSVCSSCIRKRTVTKQLVPSSPTTTSVRKRRSLEALQEEPEVQTSTLKRKRSSSFGEICDSSCVWKVVIVVCALVLPWYLLDW